MGLKLKINNKEVKSDSFKEDPLDFFEPLSIQPILVEFGNGDLNLLRDKLNEVIRRG